MYASGSKKQAILAVYEIGRTGLKAGEKVSVTVVSRPVDGSSPFPGSQ
jgi:hypothetical protein